MEIGQLVRVKDADIQGIITARFIWKGIITYQVEFEGTREWFYGSNLTSALGERDVPQYAE